jgi:hypothetical protein
MQRSVKRRLKVQRMKKVKNMRLNIKNKHSIKTV